MSGRGDDPLSRAHDQLVRAVADLASSEGWRRMLEVAARFHQYSPHNVLLITVQRPDATQVAGYRTWQSVGRQVRKGERGITILAPMRSHDPAPTDELGVGEQREAVEDRRRRARGFRAVSVFDIAQTEGASLPQVPPRLLQGAAPVGLWESLHGQVAAAGYDFRRGDCAPANGITDYVARTVTVRPDLPPAQQVKTLAHELAHVLLHAPGVRAVDLTRDRAEVEAESVAFLVCVAHGMSAQAYTVPYVAGWSGGDTTVLATTAERVVRTAAGVLTAATPAAAQPAEQRDVSVRRRREPRAADTRHALGIGVTR